MVVAGGKELTASAMYSSYLEDRYIFRCPRSKATGIIARSRPYEWIDLKNVALNPTTAPTAVKVVPVQAATTVPAVTLQ